MRLTKILPIFTTLIGVAFASLSILVRPLWYDVNDFLGTQFPVMAAVIVLGVLFIGYAVYLLKSGGLEKPRAWRHYLALAIANLFMISLLYVFFTQLGAEVVMIWRNLAHAAPYIVWLGAIGFALWFPLRTTRGRAAVIAGLAFIALLWSALPLRVAFTTRPVVYIQQGGVNVIWGTNMRAVSWLDYGQGAGLGSSLQEQSAGLKVTGDQIQRIFLPLPVWKGGLYFQAHVEGVRDIYPIDAVKAGQAQSDIVHVDWPAAGEDISFVAFSDIHERSSNYARLAKQIDWEQMDFIVQLGDLVNHVADAGQVERSILSLSTGGLDLPRVFVRGNHETRGEAARSLDEWLVPPGGNFYYTFQVGDAFIIVLDTGEDKPDDNVEYSGLVNFTAYQQEQAAWLEGVLASPEYAQAKYHIVLLHRPLKSEVAEQFIPVYNQLVSRNDIDLSISGDSHVAGIFTPEETGLPFTIANCGGSESDDMAAVTVHIGSSGIELAIIGLDGSIWESTLIGR
jgi:predicted MPP superfamily phosphohydrolase